VGAGIVLSGAASVDDPETRKSLLLSSLVYAVPALLMTVPALFRPTRTAQFMAGARPRRAGFVW
jgi:hypothetical protein